MADDNVVVAHTLRMSAALLAAGRPHQVLPLSSTTHNTPAGADTFSQLLRLELAFLAESLSVARADADLRALTEQQTRLTRKWAPPTPARANEKGGPFARLRTVAPAQLSLGFAERASTDLKMCIRDSMKHRRS